MKNEHPTPTLLGRKKVPKKTRNLNAFIIQSGNKTMVQMDLEKIMALVLVMWRHLHTFSTMEAHHHAKKGTFVSAQLAEQLCY